MLTKSCLIFLFLIIFFLTSCLKYESQNQKINSAFSLIKLNPDSSLILLSELNNQKIESEYLDAKNKLTKFYALYKTSDFALPDSLINQARNYFINTNYDYYKGLSYYLTGCNYELKYQTDSAVFWYKMADIVFSESDKYSDIKGLVKYNLGYIYLQHNHVNYALRYLKEGYKFFKVCNNTKYLAYVMKDISYCYYLMNYRSEIYLKILNDAYTLSKLSNDEINCDFILAQKGEFLFTIDKKTSKQLIKNHLLKYPRNSEKLSSYLADIYIAENKLDSAKIYINYNFNNDRNKIFYNLVNFKIHHRKGNLTESINYLLKANNLKDSLSFQLINSNISEIDNKIELTKNINEIKDINFTKKCVFIILFFTLLFLAFITFKLMSIKKRYSKESKEFQHKINFFENEMLIFTLNNNEKNDILHNKIFNRTLQTLKLKNLELNSQDKGKINEFVKDSFETILIKDNEWGEIFNEIDLVFDKKLTKLVEKYQITTNDKKVITLISLKLDITDCCLLLNLSKNTLYHRRQLIKERLFLSKDTDLDVWLTAYLTADPVPAAMLPFPVAP